TSVSPATRSAAKAEGTIGSTASPGWSEMAERGLPKCEWLTVGIEKARVPLPCGHDADLGDRDAGCRSLLAQWLDLAGRHACHDLAGGNVSHDFVVVTAGEDRFDQRGLLGERDSHAVRERNARDRDFGGNTGGAAELAKIAREAVGDVHGRRSVGAENFGNGG